MYFTRSISIVSKSMPSLRSSKRSSDDIITSSTIGSSSSSMSPEPRRLDGQRHGHKLLYTLHVAANDSKYYTGVETPLWSGREVQSYIAFCMWLLILAYCMLTRSCCCRASACCLWASIQVTWVLKTESHTLIQTVILIQTRGELQRFH